MFLAQNDILKADQFPDKMIVFLMLFSIKIQLKKAKNCRAENQLTTLKTAILLLFLRYL
jgi:hypothetical protein